MDLYLYKTGTSTPVLTIENVVSYTDYQAVTEDGGVYGPFAEDVELSSLPDCSEALRAQWRRQHCLKDYPELMTLEERRAARLAELSASCNAVITAGCDVALSADSGHIWLDAEDIIKKNPMRKIKSLKIDRAKARRPLTAEQLERLRDGCETYREKALVEFLVSSGCRLSELVGIRVDAVDWQGRSVVVLGKGGKERTVYFSVRAKLMLQEYLARRKGGEALFASSRAPYEAMRPRAVERALQKIGERAGEARRVHPHLMRHTFASNALNAGMDITIIQHLLGHTDPKTTLIYAELAPRTVKYEYERVVA